MKQLFSNKRLILSVIFISMLTLNMLVPLICDDYFYSYVFRTNKRVTNIFDIFNSEYLHYFNWGGRVLAHSLSQTFLLMPKIVFNVCNSSIYILEIYLIYLIARGKRKDNYLYLLFIHIMLWLFNCSYGEVNFWLTGSCNYLWTTTIILGFFYQYIREDVSNNNFRIFLNALVGFLAGMCNENFSFALIVMIFLIIVFMKKRKTKDIVGLVFSILGYMFLVLAPGNFSRLSTNDRGFSFTTLFLRLFLLIKNFSIILLILVVFMVIYFKKKSLKKELLIYLMGIIVCACLMSVTSDFSLRTLTGCVIFITIIIIYMLFDFQNINKYLFLSIVPFLVSYVFTFSNMLSLKSYWDGFEDKVEIARDKKNSTITYPKFISYNSHIPGSYDLSLIECDNKTDMNRYLALYYGIDRVVGSGDDCREKK